MKYYYSIFFSLFFIACQNGKETVMTDGINFYGMTIDDSGALDIATAISGLNSQDEDQVKVKGMIDAVCQAKGCWMTLTDESTDREVFIKFKDYAFFVPKDAAGRNAVVQGVLTMEETSIDELRHYAEDEGKSSEEIAAITEPKVEVKMMAEGVIIYN